MNSDALKDNYIIKNNLFQWQTLKYAEDQKIEENNSFRIYSNITIIKLFSLIPSQKKESANKKLNLKSREPRKMYLNYCLNFCFMSRHILIILRKAVVVQ